MFAIKKQIPNLFTLGNLSCGVLAILNIFNEQYQVAAYLVLLAAVLDFFDGFLARLLKVSGELGKQLDSLSDLVTFGVAPSFLLYALSYNVDGYARYAFILLAVFSSYRLAKFNIDTRQTSTFIGVPTPITGITCMSWAFIDNSVSDMIFGNAWAFIANCLVVSLLLVSEIPMPSLKIRKGPLSNYYQHLFLLLVGLLSLFAFGWFCVPILYTTYVLSSILINFAAKK
jgi:CDP-diacylglycerol---serine O-phosphatidyltransferase